MADAKPVSPTLCTAPGARAAEGRLVAAVLAAVAQRDAKVQEALARGDAAAAAALLARPFRIAVSSRSLREQVVAALLRASDRALAAVSVHTHWALALQAIERAGEAPPRGDALFGVEVRRAAREEPVLAHALGALSDGYGVVEAAARDLVEAGFDGSQAEALDESLAATGGDASERARAVVRAAERALDRMRQNGLAPRTAVLRRAEELVESRGDALLPTAALWIHGFADATGVVIDWLRALLRAFRGEAIVDLPPDPFDRSAFEAEFAKPLLERLGAVAQREPAAEAAPAAPQIALLRAPGATAEVRAVATRVRALLDGGAAPESIAIVARDPAAYRSAIATQLDRLAIPFSAHGFSPAPDARTRRVAALARLLADGVRAPLDVWLAASAHEADASPDLAVGLHVLGLGRLADLVSFDLDARLGADEDLPLPVRHGASEGSDGAEPPTTRRRLRGRRLERDRLVQAQARARALATDLGAWPEHAEFAAHRAALETLLEARLGWQRDAFGLAAVFDALAALADDVPDAHALARDEFALVAGRALESAVRATVGGKGAGVQVLSATAARSRCFARLFVLGLNRDLFPRKPQLDPLLPDRLRLAMQSVLPDLAIKARARAEERHLFAELLSASPNVVLSWHFATDTGRERARSSFIERLRQVEPGLPDETVHPLERDETAPRRAHEHLLRAALVGPRDALSPIRSAALREVDGAGALPRDLDALAATQLAVLDELDPDRSTPAGRERAAHLSPYMGRTGASAPAPAARLYVTALERAARCPWQSFLQRELGLEPAPDALESLPALSPMLVGTVVHAVLEKIVEACGGATHVSIAEAEARGAVSVPWPDEAALGALVRAEAEAAAVGVGIRSESFFRVLAQTAKDALDVARETDWTDPAGPRVLGAELSGEAAVRVAEGRVQQIAFRADRVDARAGSFRVTDYKTGNVPSDAAGPDTRRKHLLEKVERGTLLQAVAYLAAASERAERDVAGRFLFLRSDVESDLREHLVTREDGDLVERFEGVVRTVVAARDAGAYPPRLVEPGRDGAPQACEDCEFAPACSQGESSARRRLREWLDDAARDPTSWAADERAAADLLLLGRTSREEDAA